MAIERDSHVRNYHLYQIYVDKIKQPRPHYITWPVRCLSWFGVFMRSVRSIQRHQTGTDLFFWYWIFYLVGRNSLIWSNEYTSGSVFKKQWHLSTWFVAGCYDRKPKNISDDMMDALCVQIKISHKIFEPYRPNMNGAIEAGNKNIKKTSQKKTHKDRHEKLPFALHVYWNSICTSTRAFLPSIWYGKGLTCWFEISSLQFWWKSNSRK